MFKFFFKKKRRQSPNFNDRAGGQKPSMLLIHYTGMRTAEEALERLCDPEAEVSAHYVIEEDGRLHALVPEDKRAWHAGKAFWAGESDINSASIGIELVNPGEEFGYREFPIAQMKKLEALCIDLMGKYDIPPARILGHSDVSPGRKTDPGELFPWEALAARGVGLWPHPNEMDYQAAEDLILHPAGLHDLFAVYGYNPDVAFETVAQEFHRHFYPEKFQAGTERQVDIQSVAKLLSLLRKIKET